MPIPLFYPQLDQRYPNSTFILTIRDTASWLDSMRAHLEKWTLDDSHRDYRQTVRLAMYGVAGFSEDRLKSVFKTHVEKAKRYFADRPKDLLVLDICGGEGWDHLCGFLDRPIPTEPFPWTHRWARR